VLKDGETTNLSLNSYATKYLKIFSRRNQFPFVFKITKTSKDNKKIELRVFISKFLKNPNLEQNDARYEINNENIGKRIKVILSNYSCITQLYMGIESFNKINL